MLDVGDKIPAVSIVMPDGSEANTSDYLGKKWVLYFYPKDSTPGCTTEAKDFSSMMGDFAAAGVSVLGVSKDSPKRHNNFIAKSELTVPLASDEEGVLCEAMGVWILKKLYGREYMGIARATFLIGEDGVIARVWPKVKVKGHAEEVLAAAQALG